MKLDTLAILIDDAFERLEAGEIPQPVRNIFVLGRASIEELVVWPEARDYELQKRNQG